MESNNSTTHTNQNDKSRSRSNSNSSSRESSISPKKEDDAHKNQQQSDTSSPDKEKSQHQPEIVKGLDPRSHTLKRDSSSRLSFSLKQKKKDKHLTEKQAELLLDQYPKLHLPLDGEDDETDNSQRQRSESSPNLFKPTAFISEEHRAQVIKTPSQDYSRARSLTSPKSLRNLNQEEKEEVSNESALVGNTEANTNTNTNTNDQPEQKKSSRPSSAIFSPDSKPLPSSIALAKREARRSLSSSDFGSSTSLRSTAPPKRTQSQVDLNQDGLKRSNSSNKIISTPFVLIPKTEQGENNVSLSPLRSQLSLEQAILHNNLSSDEEGEPEDAEKEMETSKQSPRKSSPSKSKEFTFTTEDPKSNPDEIESGAKEKISQVNLANSNSNSNSEGNNNSDASISISSLENSSNFSKLKSEADKPSKPLSGTTHENDDEYDNEDDDHDDEDGPITKSQRQVLFADKDQAENFLLDVILSIRACVCNLQHAYLYLIYMHSYASYPLHYITLHYNRYFKQMSTKNLMCTTT